MAYECGILDSAERGRGGEGNVGEGGGVEGADDGKAGWGEEVGRRETQGFRVGKGRAVRWSGSVLYPLERHERCYYDVMATMLRLNTTALITLMGNALPASNVLIAYSSKRFKERQTMH